MSNRDPILTYVRISILSSAIYILKTGVYYDSRKFSETTTNFKAEVIVMEEV